MDRSRLLFDWYERLEATQRERDESLISVLHEFLWRYLVNGYEAVAKNTSLKVNYVTMPPGPRRFTFDEVLVFEYMQPHTLRLHAPKRNFNLHGVGSVETWFNIKYSVTTAALIYLYDLQALSDVDSMDERRDSIPRRRRVYIEGAADADSVSQDG